MANRNEDYYSRLRRGQHQAWRDEDERRYENENEANASARGGNYDQGRVQYGQGRQPGDQSGSSGRFSGYGDFGRGNYGGERSGWSGNDRYGHRDMGNMSGGSDRGWSEPYGEGQQYDQRGEYAGRSGGEDWGGGSRNYGGSQRSGVSQGSYQGYGGSQGYGGPRSYGQQNYGQQSGMGQHAGKGPKGYQRSDERLKEMISERLREDPHIDPSDVTVSVQGGKITLDGTVDSRQTKNAIEDIADQFGTQEVQNNLRVQRQTAPSGESMRQSKAGSDSDESGGSTRTKQH